MKALRWSFFVLVGVLLLIGIAGFARQRQLDAVEWGVCGKHRFPCIKGVAENGTPWRLDYVAVRGELSFFGGMGRSFDGAVASALRRFPESKRLVVILSPGGSTNAAVRTAKLLNRHGVAVSIEGDCASACALLWALADSRQSMPRARIGLHAGRPVERMPAWLHGVAEKRNRERFEIALRNAGFPQDAISHGMATMHDRIDWIDATTMRSIGVKFDWVEPVGVSRPGSDPPPAPRS